jgi:hypothetical protein
MNSHLSVYALVRAGRRYGLDFFTASSLERDEQRIIALFIQKRKLARPEEFESPIFGFEA